MMEKLFRCLLPAFESGAAVNQYSKWLYAGAEGLLFIDMPLTLYRIELAHYAKTEARPSIESNFYKEAGDWYAIMKACILRQMAFRKVEDGIAEQVLGKLNEGLVEKLEMLAQKPFWDEERSISISPDIHIEDAIHAAKRLRDEMTAKEDALTYLTNHKIITHVC